ncbi:MAG: cation:proton antiporter regulatory subunit [Ilumatobacteraceae bacterium]
MADVRETKLPGVGVRHDFTTDDGRDVGVLVHRDGRREVLVYDTADPDECTSMVTLSAADTRTLSELLGASQVNEAVTAMQRDIEGLVIEWMELDERSPAVGISIGDGAYRTRTGASLVAVVRGVDTVPAPDPTFVLQARDVAVAVGTAEGLAALRSLLQS